MTEGDTVRAGPRWIPTEEYQRIMASVPILCVDALLINPRSDEVGLIRRSIPGGEGWCLLGGAVLRDESVADAVVRHVTATLGSSVRIVPGTLRLGGLIQYFTTADRGPYIDPRKHAVSLTFSAEITGRPSALGEAIEFRWFAMRGLGKLTYGFGHGEVIRRLLDGTAESALSSPWL